MPSFKITHNAANTANTNNAPAGNNGQNVNHTKQAIDDARIIALKEQGNLTWADIAARFPGRTKGSIQVRYCRTLHKDGPARRAALAASAAPAPASVLAPAAPAPPPAPIVAAPSSAPASAPTPAAAPRSRKRSASTTTTATTTPIIDAAALAPAPKRARTTRTAARARAAATPDPPSSTSTSTSASTTTAAADPNPAPTWREPTPIAAIPAAQPVADSPPARRSRQPTRSRPGPAALSARAAARQMAIVFDGEGGVTVPARGGRARVRLSTALFGDYGKCAGGRDWGKARWEGFTGRYLG
ncbi:hypothetical protein GTA08_BOTSDO03110 [Neofusicoccum parvum]|uniref:Uncharacterized protein n=1 Tax=Neofusicoccum parvum TaxID=310453 RepID=A0ACB5SFE4_9PEZI|nr:hypothetical protein GTA08_BOTSDO03110 [Neofusicoccum parvum]